MDVLDSTRMIVDAGSLAKQLREVIETLPPQMFGGDVSRDRVREACER